MKLHIKNMVSACCKRVVKSELKKLGLYYVKVGLGEIEIRDDLTTIQREQFGIALQRFGLEIMEDKRKILVERIKNVALEIVHAPDKHRKVGYSEYISQKLYHQYNYLSSIFSKVMGTTIEQYVIALKIERAKELIVYDEHSLTEISFMLNYSSVAHLSNQFKKVTGMAPSQFKKLKEKSRRALDMM